MLAVLGELRAGADWAALGAEYFAGAPPLDAARRAGRRVLDERLPGATRGRRIGCPAMRRTFTLALAASPCSPPPPAARPAASTCPRLFAKQIDRARRAQRRADAAALRRCARTSAATSPTGRRRRGLALRHRRRARLQPGDRVLHRRVPRRVRGGQAERRPHGHAPARAHRPLPARSPAAPRARRRASSGASAARSTRSRRRSPGASSCGWPPRPSATARAELTGERGVRGDHGRPRGLEVGLGREAAGQPPA